MEGGKKGEREKSKGTGRKDEPKEKKKRTQYEVRKKEMEGITGKIKGKIISLSLMCDLWKNLYLSLTFYRFLALF